MSSVKAASSATRQQTTLPGFGATLDSEWTKLRSVRSTWIILTLGILLSVGFSALMAFVTGFTWNEWSEADQAAFDPVLYSVNGIIFTLILLIVLAVTTVTSEYSSRMIRTTFIATPQRLKVLAAKGTLASLLGIVMAVAAFLGMFFVSQPLYAAYGLETASLTDSDASRMLAFIPLSALIYILIPFCFAFLLRGAASAITVSIAFFVAPQILSAMLPEWFRVNILRFLPDRAADSLSGMIATDSVMYLSTGPAIAVLAAWLIGGLAITGIVLRRRDA